MSIILIRLYFYFANTSYIKDRLREYEVDVDRSKRRGPEVERIYFVILEMAPVTYIDSSAVQALKDLYQEYKLRDIQIAISNPSPEVLLTLSRSGLVELIGKEWYFVRVHDAVQVCLQHVQSLKGASNSPQAPFSSVENKPSLFARLSKERVEKLSITDLESGAGKDIESAYWELVVKDIQDTCKLLEPIYNETDGEDGHVSLAVSPKLANDTKGTIEAAKWLHNMVGSPCVYMKIPATDESISSMKEVISLGISVNATVMIDAYLDGLESCGMTDLSKVSSAAAFYISRMDVTLDKKLEQIGTTEALDLKGKGAVAQAVLAYQLYQKKISGPRWERLENRGAKKQRLMWASTNVKNPSYPDTFYVNSVIGRDTISTFLVQALQAFMDHRILSRTLDAKVSEAQDIYNAIEKLGIDWSSVGSELEHEVLDSFTKSFDNVLECMQKKAMNIYSFQKHV
ncbi:Transaldolase [Glycine soja]